MDELSVGLDFGEVCWGPFATSHELSGWYETERHHRIRIRGCDLGAATSADEGPSLTASQFVQSTLSSALLGVAADCT